MRRRLLPCALALLSSCSGSPDPPALDAAPAADERTRDASPGVDRLVTADRGLADANPCQRLPAAADRPRKVVVAHPFKAAGQTAGLFEVLDLSAGGKLSATGETFELDAPARDGPIHFTPDGKLGLVSLEDGSIGVFRLDGPVQVIHRAFKPSFHVTRLLIGADGEQVLALNMQWRENGGGIYRLRLRCDGTLAEEGMVTASKLPASLQPLGTQAGRSLLVVRDVLASPASHDVHLLELTSTPGLVGGVDAFGDDQAIVSAAALTSDERHLLIADVNAFSSTAGNRVAVVEVQQGKLRAAQVLAGLKDPGDLVTSPWNDTALVLGVEANTVTVLDYHPGSASEPFTVRGPAPTSSKPLLPAVAVQIRRGTLTGRVIIAENTSLRQLQLEKGGAVKEEQLLSLGTGIPAIAGALGVQP